MRTQSAGTGLVDGAFFSAFGAELAVVVDVDAAGLGVAAVDGVLAAGFCEQPPATSADAHNTNTNFFIDPPNKYCFGNNPGDYQAGKLQRGHLTSFLGESPQLISKSAATLNEKRTISQKKSPPHKPQRNGKK
jgi:hypothetical protein